MAKLVLLLASLLSGQEIIDEFRYPDTAAARAAWTAGEGTPAVELQTCAEQPPAFLLTVPFASQSKLPRIVIDHRQRRDLRCASFFSLEISADLPEALGPLTMYFRSGSGWYAASQSLKTKGRQTLVFSKNSFKAEGKPRGWEHIEQVRLCVWRPTGQEPRDTSVQFRQLAAAWNEVALLWPDTPTGVHPTERKRERDYCRRAEQLLNQLGIAADRVESESWANDLQRRRIAVLATPLNGHAVSDLQQFVAEGGKVLSLAALPPSLAQALRLPVSLPANREVQVSDRGALLRLRFENENQAPRLLAKALCQLDPIFGKTIAIAAIERAGHIGHCNTVSELLALLAKSDSTANRLRADGLISRAVALRALEGKDYPTAFTSAEDARVAFTDAYLRVARMPNGEPLAIWNHTGLGAYPGDWQRSASLLAQHGFTMVFPNMLWAGAAHYPSELLPRSSTFERYGDQISQCCRAAKKVDLQVHVWKVHFNLATAPRDFLEKMRRQNRTQMSAKGESLDWLCPSHPENRRLEVSSLVEVAKNYPVSGLHLDYMRYPGGDACYCPGCRQAFEQQSNRPVVDWPKDCLTGKRSREYNVWRCQQITSLVAEISRAARRTRPGIKISAAVFGAYPACRDSVAQDWPQWVRSGYLDFVCPMNYTADNREFVRLVEKQRKLVGQRVPLYAGIGASAAGIHLAPDQILGQMVLGRAAGATGFTIFDLTPTTAERIIPALGQASPIEGK